MRYRNDDSLSYFPYLNIHFYDPVRTITQFWSSSLHYRITTIFKSFWYSIIQYIRFISIAEQGDGVTDLIERSRWSVHLIRSLSSSSRIGACPTCASDSSLLLWEESRITILLIPLMSLANN